jgi:hypothetical protein
MRRRIAVAEGVVGHDVQAGFDSGMKCLVKGGVVAHGCYFIGNLPSCHKPPSSSFPCRDSFP